MVNPRQMQIRDASVSDVLTLCSCPMEITAAYIAAKLGIGLNRASELRRMAVRNWMQIPGLQDRAPTQRERDLMQRFRFSRDEARLVAQMIDRGEVRA